MSVNILREVGQNRYMVDPKQLANDRCYVFDFAVPHNSMTYLIMHTLENITFTPNTKANELFEAAVHEWGPLVVTEYSFPQEHRAICEKAARLYDQQVVRKPQFWSALSKDGQFQVGYPEVDRILWFEGPQMKQQ